MILRKASPTEQPKIWEILQQAIEQRKNDGSTQWQNGYPNEQTIVDDIENGSAFVLVDQETIVAYAAIVGGIEPNYIDISGNWLSDEDYVTVHRVALTNAAKGRGIATTLFKIIEDFAVTQQIYSIRVDTNFDNFPMLSILNKLAYVYCGEIFAHGAARKAFQKQLARSTE
ncbi:GNAT superfamily N-acetyltransferase [Pedobacter sp. UYEF25]